MLLVSAGYRGPGYKAWLANKVSSGGAANQGGTDEETAASCLNITQGDHDPELTSHVCLPNVVLSSQKSRTFRV